MNADRSLRWVPVITAEKVDEARRELGLGETATLAQLTERYRDLARRWHPDVRGDRLDERDRFRHISQAKALLSLLIRGYRYSLRSDDIERDQEDGVVREIRQFGGGLYSEGVILREELDEFHRTHPDHVTAENVDRAAQVLGLGATATWEQIDRTHRTLAAGIHPDRFPENERAAAGRRFTEIEWAFRVLRRLVDGYRYSFRPADVRRDQEDPLETHRRQFANDPIWAGGEYDDPGER